MSFSSSYRPDNNTPLKQRDLSSISRMEPVAPGISDFLGRYSGTSFNKGLYRVLSVSEIARWTATVAVAFPSFKGNIFCFSCDWLGRHFALDFERKENGKCLVLMFEPGTGQALEIPATFRDFHEVELVQYQNDALAVDFHRSWLDAGGAVPEISECVGYKKPLFLGGEDILSNLELSDMDVYWSICGQLLEKVRGLPAGTKIGDVRIT
jgi:hypothetical protein